MIAAKYSLISFVPDPARREVLNIGAVVWRGADFRLRIDPKAAARVVRDNPSVNVGDIKAYDGILHDQLGGPIPFAEARWLSIVARHQGMPLLITEPRHTTLSGSAEELDDALAVLLDRLVTPLALTNESKSSAALTSAALDSPAFVDTLLAPLVNAQRAYAHYIFDASRSGVPRQVNYFLNSGANVAIDTLVLPKRKLDEAYVRIDAEAFKIEDISDKNAVTFIVYCEVPPGKNHHRINEDVRRIIESVGATVFTEPQEAEFGLNSVLTAANS